MNKFTVFEMALLFALAEKYPVLLLVVIRIFYEFFIQESK